MNDEQRRQALAEFLQTRRARLSPKQVGLPAGSRRRTPGLRREEVAQLANISAAWYTYLEQGRDIRVSKSVLNGIALALKLSFQERQHLFRLADQPLSLMTASEPVRPVYQRVLEQLGETPAYITGQYSNILVWNRAASMVFGDFSEIPEQERSLLWLIFAQSSFRQRFINYEQVAQESVAIFRERSSQYADDPDLQRRIEALKQISPEFCDWWLHHDVCSTCVEYMEIEHPVVGRLLLEPAMFQVSGNASIRCCVYMAADSMTKSKLEQLLS